MHKRTTWGKTDYLGIIFLMFYTWALDPSLDAEHMVTETSEEDDSLPHDAQEAESDNN